MANNFSVNLKKEFEKIVEDTKKKLADDDMQTIGSACIELMKDLISKGISPIQGNGRFEGYKAAGNLKTQKKVSKSLRGALRVGGGKGLQDIEVRRNLLASVKAEGMAKLGYPYSVQHKYSDKKPRPVNLFLSGKFLESLIYKVNKKELKVVIQFDDKLSELKEQGHREGVNGQPKRPIFPINSESLAKSILVELENLLIKAIGRIEKSSK